MNRTHYTVTTEGLQEARELMKRYPDIVLGEMIPSMGRAVTQLASAIKTYTPVDQGRLIGAIGGHVTVGMTGGYVESEAGRIITAGGTPVVKGIVDAGGVEYAPAVEAGRRPGFWPPYAPLVRWAHLHGMDESAGYKIAAAIFKRGLPAHRMFALGLAETRGWIDAEFQRMLARITERLGGKYGR